MKLYLLSQDENNDYDTYDAFIVCAENEADARTFKPDNTMFNPERDSGAWTKNESAITCQEIGVANKNQERGVILASFNAG